MSPDQVFWFAAGSTAVLGAAAAVHRYVVSPTRTLFRRVNRTVDAWNGEPARDGLPSRPGVIDRLVSIEQELRPNSGSSLRDAVDRSESRGLRLEKQLEAHAGELTAHLEQAQLIIVKGEAAEAALHAADAANSVRLDSIDDSLARLESGDTVSGRLVSEAMPVVARATPADIDVHPAD